MNVGNDSGHPLHDEGLTFNQVHVEKDPEPEWVTFYSWIEVYEDGPKMKGANTVIHIQGGERRLDNVGKVYNTPNEEVKFTKGILHTDSPTAIRDIRKQIARGANITEDYEAYTARVMEPARYVERQKIHQAALIEQNAKLIAENSRLTEILRAQGHAARVEADQEADQAAAQGPEAAAASGLKRRNR